MLGVAGIFLLGAFMVWLEVPSLVKKKDRKGIVIFFFFLILGMFLNSLLILHVPVANPLDFLIKFYEPVSQWIDWLLKP